MIMKIDAIVREEKFEDVKNALMEIEVNGLTVSQVMGCGLQRGYKEIVRGMEVEPQMQPKIKFEIVVSSEEWAEKTIEAIKKAGYVPKKDIVLALDIASTEMYEAAKKEGKDGYYFWKTNILKSKEEMIEYIENLCEKYPIVSVEDGLAEEDWESWKILTQKIGNKVQLVGDDLFVTNPKRLQRGINNNIANCILIKPNQIGTLTETLNTILMAQKNGYKTIISHRSGETEDTTIADIAVAVNAGKNTMERQNFIIDNLVVEEDVIN